MTATVAERRIEYVPLDEIAAAASNPKNHDLPGISRSIGRFGFVAPSIIDDRTGRLVAGHGRTLALRYMRENGQPVPAGIRLDNEGGWLVPVQHGWASRDDTEAQAYLVADNEWTMRGAWDTEQLADFLADIVAADPDLLAVTGFTPADLDDLLAAVGDAVHYDTFPATEAAYAETPEEEAERAARHSAYNLRPDNADPGTAAVTEMILIYAVDDRAELGELINTCRSGLGNDLKTSEIILRAARVLAALATRDGPDDTDWQVLAELAGIPEPGLPQ